MFLWVMEVKNSFKFLTFNIYIIHNCGYREKRGLNYDAVCYTQLRNYIFGLGARHGYMRGKENLWFLRMELSYIDFLHLTVILINNMASIMSAKRIYNIYLD